MSNKIWNIIETIMDLVIRKILHINLSDSNWEALLQFVKFGIVGVSNTLVYYVIYVLSLFIFQTNALIVNVDYLVAQVIAFLLSVLWSFYWNNKYVFKQDENQNRNMWQVLIKTYISYAFTGLFLNSIFSLLWVEWIGVPKIFAPIINLLVNVPINFFMNKFWAFGDGKKAK